MKEVNVLYLRKGRAMDKCSEIKVFNPQSREQCIFKIKANILIKNIKKIDCLHLLLFLRLTLCNKCAAQMTVNKNI